MATGWFCGPQTARAMFAALGKRLQVCCTGASSCCLHETISGALQRLSVRPGTIVGDNTPRKISEERHVIIHSPSYRSTVSGSIH